MKLGVEVKRLPDVPNNGGSAMYKHILVPTDGSELFTQAARAAVALAKSSGARITAFYATGSPGVL